MIIQAWYPVLTFKQNAVLEDNNIIYKSKSGTKPFIVDLNNVSTIQIQPVRWSLFKKPFRIIPHTYDLSVILDDETEHRILNISHKGLARIKAVMDHNKIGFITKEFVFGVRYYSFFRDSKKYFSSKRVNMMINIIFIPLVALALLAVGIRLFS